eukprot:TRINITY_DN111_c0_g1_i3.p1 TRINITY_DN111_c0_g1~~TRINITY_DN111_c0_g1_i3.p1  ORF type:complete len:282 (+),score=104.26 TRINITY_DN111_c0_g1_i3:73-918(+)
MSFLLPNSTVYAWKSTVDGYESWELALITSVTGPIYTVKYASDNTTRNLKAKDLAQAIYWFEDDADHKSESESESEGESESEDEKDYEEPEEGTYGWTGCSVLYWHEDSSHFTVLENGEEEESVTVPFNEFTPENNWICFSSQSARNDAQFKEGIQRPGIDCQYYFLRANGDWSLGTCKEVYLEELKEKWDVVIENEEVTLDGAAQGWAWGLYRRPGQNAWSRIESIGNFYVDLNTYSPVKLFGDQTEYTDVATSDCKVVAWKHEKLPKIFGRMSHNCQIL